MPAETFSGEMPALPLPRQAFVGVGANLGDRTTVIRSAIARLAAAEGILQVESSELYETAPVGVTDQPPFLNLVLGVETRLTPEELLTLLQHIEQEFGRVRTLRWGPRTLDLDLLVFEGEIRTTPLLTLPHPRMFERGFVLVPLRELLAREPFRTPRWHALREQVAAARVDESGVARWRSQGSR